MQLGMIGLGRMGANMARRLRRAGIEVVGHDRDAALVAGLAAECGVIPVSDLDALVAALTPPRSVWVMLPAGEITTQTIAALGARLAPGDLLVDGANGHYQDAMTRHATLAARGIDFVDAGVSGGVWGLDNGYGLMLGGDGLAVERLRPVIEALAPTSTSGWVHCGPAGAGHYVKMIHNGIEYGLMQAYAEGFALLRAKGEFNLDLAEIAESWRHGSVVRSWLLDLTADALAANPALIGIAPVVADSGEGRWTAIEAIERGVPAPVIGAALNARFSSQGAGDFGSRLLAAMRQAFGAHAVTREAD
ncbi:MAG: decarboxylating 6-phosphogluconate dehydrogenase [Gammaproteobacteria bacterium]|nr:decarboxylating 6-phosphogluconate dehydrogenase [Gammaproteobacteria bacterium]